MGKDWWKQKTFWAGVVGVLSGVGMIVTGDLTTGIIAVVNGFGLIFLRQAIANVPK